MTSSTHHAGTHAPGRRGWAARVAMAAVATAIAAVLIPQPVAAAARTVFSDDFSRSAASGWGSGPAGRYLGSVSPGTLSVDGATAGLRLSPASSVSILAGTASADDVHAETGVRLDQLAGRTYLAFILRYQQDGSAYRGRLELDAGGVPSLTVSRLNRGTEKQVATVRLGAPMIRGQWYTLSYSVTGSSPVKIEAALSPRGAASVSPQLRTTDDSAARITSAGRVGLWAYASRNAGMATNLRLDNLSYTDAATPLSSAPSQPTPTVTPSPNPSPTVSPAPDVTPTPTPTPPPVPTPDPSTSGVGSVEVGRATYLVPRDALFVDANARGDGTGSVSAPFTTVQRAVDAARAGATIVVRAGVYHEAVSIPSNKPLTVQAYPNEAVWFDGSRPVTNWTRSGSVWVSTGWTAAFDSSMAGRAAMFVNPSYPTAKLPDQLFVDGAALAQVATAAEVVPGTFAVETTSQRLLIGTEPRGHEVRASDLRQAFDVRARNTTLQGFGVRRYATTHADRAQVRTQNVGAVVRNLVVEDGAFIGLAVENDNSVIDHVTARRNGLMGIGANQAYNLVLKNSLVTDNNSEHFNVIPVAGGIKITRSRDVTVSNNVISTNDGSGLWLDESCWNVTIVGNTTNDNGTTGIQVELSDAGIIAGNTSTGSRIGIQIIDSGNVQIYNNNLGANADNGIRLKQDERRSATHATGRDPRMGIDPAVPWITRNITISNNVFGAGGRWSIRANDSVTFRAVDSWNVIIRGNLFNNYSAGGPTMVSWGRGDNHTFDNYQTPGDLSTAKNPAWANAMAATALPVDQMGAEVARASSIAVPLPADVALAWGKTPGAPFLGSSPH